MKMDSLPETSSVSKLKIEISKKEGSDFSGATLVLGSVIGGTWTNLDHIHLLLICPLPRWFEKTADASEIEVKPPVSL